MLPCPWISLGSCPSMARRCSIARPPWWSVGLFFDLEPGGALSSRSPVGVATGINRDSLLPTVPAKIFQELFSQLLSMEAPSQAIRTADEAARPAMTPPTSLSTNRPHLHLHLRLHLHCLACLPPPQDCPWLSHQQRWVAVAVSALETRQACG